VSLDVSSLLDAVQSHALASGVFDRVTGHEPKSAPGSGVTAAVWAQSIGPVPSSGLASTSVRVEFMVRIYQSMLSEPQDAIDPAVLTAVDVLMAAYTGDFTLGGLVRQVDLLGNSGQGLSAQAGYLTQDQRTYRVVDVTLPIIVNDLWQQSP
jgi:hypothetical protein